RGASAAGQDPRRGRGTARPASARTATRRARCAGSPCGADRSAMARSVRRGASASHMLTGMATRRADAPPPPLHDLEAEIMEEVWDQRETTVRLVMESLNRKAKPPRAYTTYMTVMRRLADKGLLDRTRVGRGDAYVPRLSREDYRRRRAGA